MLQNFPMKMQKEGIEYLAAVTRSGQEFQETNSEVCVTIPRQGRAILWQKIYTEFSQFKGIVPEEECMIGPVVELHTSNRSSQPSGKMHYKISVPHCLKKVEQLASIKVRTGDIYMNIPFTELRRKSEVHDGMRCFEVDERFITIYTPHFCQFVCSACGKTCSSYIKAYPFGILTQEEDGVSDVKVQVFLCCSLYDIEDFRMVCNFSVSSSKYIIVRIIEYKRHNNVQTFKANLKSQENVLSLILYSPFFKKLMQSLEGLGLRQLVNFNFVIPCENFMSEKSEVTVGLTVREPWPWEPINPDDKRWESDAKSFSKVLVT